MKKVLALAFSTLLFYAPAHARHTQAGDSTEKMVLHIYSHPQHAAFKVDNDENLKGTFQLIDAGGKSASTTQLGKGENTIQLKAVPAGDYDGFLVDESGVKKFILKVHVL